MRVVLTRGEVVESEHLIDVVVASHEGPVVVWGDADRAVIPRSAIKFVQALPLLRSGAADRYSISDIELVLACSSHSGESAHVEAVAAWLARIGCSESDLECGPSAPIGEQAMVDHHRAGVAASPILNCCSGKHTGLLAVARHLGLDIGGYIEAGHPVQTLVTEAIEEFTGQPLAGQRPGRDGCGIPTFAIALSGLAGAMARLASPNLLEPTSAAAARRLMGAVQGREFWISGTGRHEVALGAAIDEPLLAKIGAEGVFMVALPDRGLGISLKARDGATRACEAAISAVLAWLGVLPTADGPEPADGDLLRRDLVNKAGEVIGRCTVEVGQPTLMP